MKSENQTRSSNPGFNTLHLYSRKFSDQGNFWAGITNTASEFANSILIQTSGAAHSCNHRCRRCQKERHQNPLLCAVGTRLLPPPPKKKKKWSTPSVPGQPSFTSHCRTNRRTASQVPSLSYRNPPLAEHDCSRFSLATGHRINRATLLRPINSPSTDSLKSTGGWVGTL